MRLTDVQGWLAGSTVAIPTYPTSQTGLRKSVTLVLLETAAVAGVVCVGWLVRRRQGRLTRWSVAPVAGVGVLAVCLTLGSVPAALSTLNAVREITPRRQDAQTYCLVEDHADALVRFVRWLRHEIPAHDVYGGQFPPQPDPWCLTLMLLPRLPASDPAKARWLVYWGWVPPVIDRRIARHASGVFGFARGYALVKLVR